jgi:ABC-type phosphate transport system substrate-binding protein
LQHNHQEFFMKTKTYIGRLCGTTSVLALSAAAMIGASAPAAAQSTAVYGGGSTLVSLAMRQIMDCYNGATLSGDGYSFDATFDFTAPTPSKLPQDTAAAACGNASPLGMVGLYAAVGSGSGQRGYLTNDARHLLRSGNVVPAVPPVFLDAADGFGAYPYPRIDFGASDAPLATTGALTTVSFVTFTPSDNWQDVYAANPNGTIATSGSTTVTYDPAVYGPAIQLPTIEAPVAIAINTNNDSGIWAIQSALSPATKAGSAIQLATAQLCAIFSGQVSDWSSVAAIAALDKNGGVLAGENFSSANTAAGVAAQAYTTSSLPIRVVFRSDGSGTSFIITNYLASSCPQLDTDGTKNYAKIFTGIGVNGATTANLPNTTFANLISNINAVTGSTTVTSTWIGANGSGAVAAAVSNDSANSGRIGYVSADFTQPYSAASTAPRSASVQNENLRGQGVYHPGDLGKTFVAPTPDGADASFTGLTPPSPDLNTGAYTATQANWNVYAQVHPSGTRVGGINVAGKSRLGVPVTANAYPVTGTAFMFLYSCYNTSSAPSRVNDIINFLNWYYLFSPNSTGATNPDGTPVGDAAAVLRNNGFHEMNAEFANAISGQYLTPGSGTAIADSSTQSDGCSAVALNSGAN